MTNYKNKKLPEGLSLQTKLIREGNIRSNFGETSEAIFMNSGFCYNDAETAESRFNGEDPGYVYSRYVNPTMQMLEDRLTALEEGAETSCVMASGMAAVFASIMCQVKAGDHIIANRVLFGSCYHIINNILPNYGIEVTFVDGTSNAEFAKAFKKNTTIVFVETPANPNLELTDIAALAKLCKTNKACLIIDNVFASPLNQAPLKLGADVVVYSTTKHMDGQGRTLGGAVLGSEEFIKETLLPFHRHTGPAMSPFNAWVILKSLETFPLRMERLLGNALSVAKLLESHPKVKRVIYPGLESHPQHELAKKQMSGFGNLVAFELHGSKQDIFKFMNNLKIVDISNNLGDVKSLITHPATTTHSNIEEEERIKLGISNSLLRLSVGMEDIKDLEKDLNNSLDN
jgi:O-succinylhomoserine sulfhydrylase